MPDSRKVPATATGAHERVRMYRTGQMVIIHGTLTAYDPETGSMSLLMDTQPEDADPIAFTHKGAGVFTDAAGLEWRVVSQLS